MGQKPLFTIGEKPLFLGQRPLIPNILYMWNIQNLFYSIYTYIYGIHRFIIKLLFSRNNRSDSNNNQIFDYEFGMQGLCVNFINILQAAFLPIFLKKITKPKRN